jgi:hypothetical protein
MRTATGDAVRETDLQTAVDAEISTAWVTIDRMIDWSVSFLPKLVIGIVLGRLTQWGLTLLGLGRRLIRERHPPPPPAGLDNDVGNSHRTPLRQCPALEQPEHRSPDAWRQQDMPHARNWNADMAVRNATAPAAIAPASTASSSWSWRISRRRRISRRVGSRRVASLASGLFFGSIADP